MLNMFSSIYDLNKHDYTSETIKKQIKKPITFNSYLGSIINCRNINL